MTDATNDDNNNTDPATQGLSFEDFPDQNYDSGDTKTLLDLVFHGLRDDEHIATFFSKTGQPSYPAKLNKTFSKIDRTPIPHAFYYATSSLTLDNDGKLYNRKQQFSALHVVVLDDIGTKVNEADLPEDLIPNYIIESSKGNYQYGFILDEPIRDIALADALVHLVYTSGYSDGGGKLVTKAVRLPAGVNCKKGSEKVLDPVSLIEINNEFWSPEELVKVLDIGITWDQVKEDPTKVVHGKNNAIRSVSPWAAVPIMAESVDGIVDPMLEYLYSEDLVKHDNGVDWVTIECPWHEGHTTGGDTAGYSPLGRGGVEFQHQRGFKCMHDHCSTNKTPEFLQIMAMHGAEELPVRDEAAFLMRDYVYDSATDSAVRVANTDRIFPTPLKGFKNQFNTKTLIYTNEGKPKRVPISSIWENARHRVVVNGSSYDPSTPNTIIDNGYGINRLNTFLEPPWGDGEFDNDDVAKFVEIAKFLMPIEEEYNYFMQWLAAKASDRSFKGNAILMVATTQGVGRTMFTDLIADMFTRSNCGKVTFPELIADGGFNEWASNMLVFCDEVMTDKKALYSSYESLKDKLDPRPKEIIINKKYGAKSPEINYASYILLTNHAAAIGALRGDRRIYTITNPMVRKSPEYYAGIEEWRGKLDKEGNPAWIKSVWRWLRKQPYDTTMLNAPAPMTRGKSIMQAETEGLEEVIVKSIYAHVAPAMPSNLVKQLAIEACDMAGVDHIEAMRNFKPAMLRMTSNLQGFKEKQRVGDKVYKFRVISSSIPEGHFPSLSIDNKDSVNDAIAKSLVAVKEITDNKEKRLALLEALAEIIRDVV